MESTVFPGSHSILSVHGKTNSQQYPVYISVIVVLMGEHGLLCFHVLLNRSEHNAPALAESKSVGNL